MMQIAAGIPRASRRVTRLVGRGFSRDIKASKKPASTRRNFRRAFRLRRRDSITQEILLLSKCSRMRLDLSVDSFEVSK